MSMSEMMGAVLAVKDPFGINEEEIRFLRSMDHEKKVLIYLRGILWGCTLKELKDIEKKQLDPEAAEREINQALCRRIRRYDTLQKEMDQASQRADQVLRGLTTVVAQLEEIVKQKLDTRNEKENKELESRDQTIQYLKKSFDSMSLQAVTLSEEKKELQKELERERERALKEEKEAERWRQQVETIRQNREDTSPRDSYPRSLESSEAPTQGRPGIFRIFRKQPPTLHTDPDYLARMEHEEKLFIDNILLSDAYTEEQKTFLEKCFNAGDSYYKIAKYAHPKLSVRFMQDIRERRRREGY